METHQPFSQAALDWFQEGERLVDRADASEYEPFAAAGLRTQLATMAASIAGLSAALWLLA